MSLQIIFPILATIASIVYAKAFGDNWSWIQIFVCAALALDISGGIVTNSTSAAKRWYHRKGQGFWQHYGFNSLHLLHLALVSWVFLEFNITWLLISGAILLIATSVILLVSLYLQRPTAMIAFSIALILSFYVLETPQGLEWFLPLFYLKLLICHLVREEPYQPIKKF